MEVQKRPEPRNGGEMESAYLTDLPHELLHDILKEVDFCSLLSLRLTCQIFNAFIKGNKTLHRDVYLERLDKPTDGLDWEIELGKLKKLEEIMSNDDAHSKLSHIEFVADTVSRYLQTANPQGKPSLNVSLLSSLFSEEQYSNRDLFLCNSTTFYRARTASCAPATNDVPELTFAQRQASAKLHTLLGNPIASFGRTRSCRTYPYACSLVYDLRNYTVSTRWGPFMSDGSMRVDWERMEGIMVVLGHNLRLFGERTGGGLRDVWGREWKDAVKGSYNSMPINGPKKDTPPPTFDGLQDPFGVEGTYMRVVCFLDYTELFAYNFANQPPPGVPREPLDTGEAIRLIIMELKVTRIQPAAEGDKFGLPTVFFEGTSRSLHASWDPNANSRIRGSVRMTNEGEVRWTTYSVYDGEERWKSEGIQVGGIKSARGVLGNWFDKDFDVHGPAGPTAFWKISDQIDEQREDSDVEED